MSLIRDSFGKTLVEDYFIYATPNMIAVAEFQKIYAGIVICESVHYSEIVYIDKIAVSKYFQGKGIASKLLEITGIEKLKCCWRSKIENPINEYYMRKSEGHINKGQWNIYWKNLDKEQQKTAIEYSISKKSTIK